MKRHGPDWSAPPPPDSTAEEQDILYATYLADLNANIDHPEWGWRCREALTLKPDTQRGFWQDDFVFNPPDMTMLSWRFTVIPLAAAALAAVPVFFLLKPLLLD